MSAKGLIDRSSHAIRQAGTGDTSPVDWFMISLSRKFDLSSIEYLTPETV